MLNVNIQLVDWWNKSPIIKWNIIFDTSFVQTKFSHIISQNSNDTNYMYLCAKKEKRSQSVAG